MNTYKTYLKIYNDFKPRIIKISGNFSDAISSLRKTNLTIYGEIHGIKENADIIYTLCHKLNIKHLGIECSTNNKVFLETAIKDNPDFSLIGTDIFDASILSIEMIKTIATLVREGIVDDISCLDTFFDESEEIDEKDISPSGREQKLADNIIKLDLSKPTLCILGQWHTEIEPVSKNIDDSTTEENLHYSALYRLRKINPEIAFIHNIYRSGSLFNDGRVIDLPIQNDLSSEYMITNSNNDNNFELIVPLANRITLPSKHILA